MGKTNNSYPAKTENFVETEVDGERVIMQIDNGYFFTMNPTAEAVWSQISGDANLEQIIASVAEEFDVTVEACRPDIEEFMEELQNNKLVIIA